jgi:hypothetical protein
VGSTFKEQKSKPCQGKPRQSKSEKGKPRKAAFGAALTSGFLSASKGWAAGLGSLGLNVASNFTGIAKAIQMFGFVAGLTLVVMGLMELYHTGRQHDASLKGGITKCAVGAALLAVDALISSFSTTIFGGNESGTGLGGLGL